MRDVVVDASLFGPLIIPDEHDELHAALMPILIEGRALVPQHWRLEISNLTLSALRRGRVSRDKLVAGVAIVEALGIETDAGTNEHALRRTLDLAIEHRLTSYDAAYLELALRSASPLFTRDTDLIRAARATGVALLA